MLDIESRKGLKFSAQILRPILTPFEKGLRTLETVELTVEQKQKNQRPDRRGDWPETRWRSLRIVSFLSISFRRGDPCGHLDAEWNCTWETEGRSKAKTSPLPAAEQTRLKSTACKGRETDKVPSNLKEQEAPLDKRSRGGHWPILHTPNSARVLPFRLRAGDQRKKTATAKMQATQFLNRFHPSP
jgi:hypothetical protein